MFFEDSQDVANDYERLLKSGEEYDVIIYAGGSKEEIHAHSFVLRIRSQYFRTRFSTESFERRNGKFIFKIPNTSSQAFNIIIR